VRVHGGEIDLVARRARTLAFVEVKARSTTQAAAWAVDEQRLQRVAAAAEQLTARFGRGCDTVRIDVVLIVPGRLPKHQVNVWLG
jgi:putative endonuclease